jgi:hypothetical protein
MLTPDDQIAKRPISAARAVNLAHQRAFIDMNEWRSLARQDGLATVGF